MSMHLIGCAIGDDVDCKAKTHAKKKGFEKRIGGVELSERAIRSNQPTVGIVAVPMLHLYSKAVV